MKLSFQLKKGAVEFSPVEHAVVLKYFEILQKEFPGLCAWISDTEIEKVKFYWAPVLDSDSGIIGCWDPSTPNSCYISPVEYMSYAASMNMHPEFNIASYLKDPEAYMRLNLVFGEEERPLVMLHEFYHRWQFRTAPIFYIFNRLITVFIDNGIVDRLVYVIKDFFRKDKITNPVEEEECHLPWLYDFTLEADCDKNTDQNPQIREFTTKLSEAWGYYCRYTENNFKAAKMKAVGHANYESPRTMASCQADCLDEYDTSIIKYVAEMYDLLTESAMKDYVYIKK